MLLRKGRYEEVLSMLSGQLPDPSILPDIALERAVLQAWADVALGRSSAANEALMLASGLSNDKRLFLTDISSSLTSQAFNAWGNLEVQLSNLDGADRVFRRALDLARKRNDQYQLALTQLNLSLVALQREHFDEALDWADMAFRSAREIRARSLLEEARGNIAWANYKLGNFEEALAGFQEAEKEAKEIGEISDRLEWLNDAGLSLYRLGNPQEAEKNYKSALQIAENYRDSEEIIGAHSTLAELLLQTGNLDQSSVHIDQALAMAHSSGRTFDEMNTLFLKSLIAARQADMTESGRILNDLNENRALLPSLRWQVEDAIANQYAQANQPGLANQWYRQSIATFESQRSTLRKEESKLPFSINADQLYGNYIRFLIQQKQSDDALQWLDQARARTLEEGLHIASSDFSTALRRKVPTCKTAARLHGTILIYSLAPDKSYLWAIDAAETRFFQLPGEAVINERVRNYQHAILESKDPISDAYVDGMELYKILVAPAQSMIPKGSQVYVIPDGSLSTLNFETLLAPGGGLHYWIEDAVITNASSLKLLARFDPNAHKKTAKKLLLVGNPVSPDEKYPNLPNAANEIEEVSRHFPAGEQSVFTQQQALPSAYENSTPGQYSYIHFVAHGTSSSASPLDSAIVLTRSPQSPDSFKLYARDVIRHPLQADLVAVSACYGSGSRTYGGEGLIGLSWAFLRAGAHYVIGSLWQVSDAAAPQLMDSMYDDLMRGQNPAAALREAKLTLVHSKGVFRKPLYWATFQIYGGS